MPESRHLLEVDDLRVEFQTDKGAVKAVDGISYTLERGEVLAILGESGSGKTVHARAILGILDIPPASIKGSVRLEGVDLIGLRESDIHQVRGERISMLFQDPHTALDPVFSVGSQIEELLRARRSLSRREARREAIDLLTRVGIASPKERLKSFPHQLSGGIAQRVMVAMSIALNPEVLLADEPTSSLDVTVQAQVLELLESLMRDFNVGLVLITHNLDIAAGFADRIAVMYAGKIVETGPAREIHERPIHPYTGALLKSVPKLDLKQDRLQAIDGSPPNLINPPSGCPFHPRCPFAIERCRVEVPELREWLPGREAACHRALEVEP
ncbi:MAG: oligopeptide transport system ATP-binding protein [Actinomycetota bacterium]|nr:oligopeptide transport system ATP-binding protein [Actinomycetota bacterium]